MLSLKRAEVQVDSVLGDTRKADDSWNFHLQGHPDIGYIRIRTFGDRTIQELLPAVTALKKEHVKGLIIDLRFDPGGRTRHGRRRLQFIPPAGQDDRDHEGTRRQSRGRRDFQGAGADDRHADRDFSQFAQPSASEIVAACLQDHHRAIICGQRTYGKGTVQRVLHVESNKSVLKLTTAHYWRPSNKNIDRRKDAKDTDEWGVMPDAGFVVPMDDKQTEAMLKDRSERDIVHRAQPPATAGKAPPTVDVMKVDPQLKRAVEFLEKKPASPTPATVPKPPLAAA